jgi:hypothetical protein
LEDEKMKIQRIWAMPSKWTFQIPPIKDVLLRHVGNGVGWADPFAGENSPAEFTNDLNPNRPTKFHMDALDFLKQQPSNALNGVLFDPPYSFTQAKECYDSYGKDLFVTHDKIPTKMDYWASCKKEIARQLKTGGLAICFGWNSNGIGHNRGFEMLEVLILPHGGSKNDTIVTIERKFTSELDFHS